MQFPSSPTLNQTYTFANKTWKWNGSGWQINTTNSLSWSNVTDKPAEFTPSAHSHTISDITGLQEELDAAAHPYKLIYPTGTDDQNIINAATDGFTGTVVMASGTWVVTGPIFLRAGIVLRGVDKKSTLIVLSGAGNFSYANLTMNTHGMVISDCYIYHDENNAGPAISNYNASRRLSGLTLENIYLEGDYNKRTSPLIDLTHYYHVIRNCDIFGSFGNNGIYPVKISSAQDVLITGCSFEGNGGSVMVDSSYSIRISDSLFASEQEVGTTKYDLVISDSYHCIISHNTFSENSWVSGVLFDSANNNVFSNNIGLGNDWSYNETGIVLQNSYNNVFSNNSFLEYNTTALIIDAGSTDNVVEGSFFSSISDSSTSTKYSNTFNGTSWITTHDQSGLTLSDDNATNTTQYIPMARATSGDWGVGYTASTKLYFNPSTGTLNSTNFNSLSDARFKTNVKPIQDTASSFSQINPVSFEWKDTGKPAFGVIAQEIETLFPALVNTNEDGIKSVSYDQLVPILISVVQQQQREIDAIKSKLGE